MSRRRALKGQGFSRAVTTVAYGFGGADFGPTSLGDPLTVEIMFVFVPWIVALH